MTAGDSIVSVSDRDLMKRLTIVLALGFTFAAAFTHLERTYSAKFFDSTGDAQWIWAQHRMSDNLPVAFFAAREFDLPENRAFTHLKVVGDPEYTVYLNGSEIAGRRVGGIRGKETQRVLDLYDISALAKTGRNRIVIAVRSPNGTGGLIASIDIAPEVANWVVTDGRWTIYRRWNPNILLRHEPGAVPQGPAIIGAPPIGRWNYLATEPRELTPPLTHATPPNDVFPEIGFIPKIKTEGGVAVAGTDRARATVFDFGFTKGQLRIINPDDRVVSETILVRFAFARHELQFPEWNLRPLVFAPGENVVTTPEVHDFRYAMAFAKGAPVRAELVR